MVIEGIRRRLRLTFVGGGPGSVIGDVHRAGTRTLLSGDTGNGLVSLTGDEMPNCLPESQGIFGLLLAGERKKPARISPKSPHQFGDFPP